MSERKRGETESWVLPRGARPPLLAELVERIDEAVAVSRASEAAVMTVGAAALDAADQARRAAELAERASAAMACSQVVDTPAGTGAQVTAAGMDSFSARADRVAERLRRLQRLPLSA